MKNIFLLVCVAISSQLVAASITWSSPPTTISTTGVNASNPLVGVDTNGDVVAAWIEGGHIKSRNLPSGGSWGSINSLSSFTSTSPALAVDPSGNATLLWLEGSTLYVKQQPSGGSWGVETTLALTGASTPEISVDACGNLVAVWVEAGAVMTANKLNGSIGWSIPYTLAVSGTHPQVTISSMGAVTAVWHGINAVSLMDSIYESQSLISGTCGSQTMGTWSAALVVSDPDTNSDYPHVAMDGNGTAVIVWFAYNEIGAQYSDVIVQASSLLATEYTWTTPVDITAPGIVNPANLSLGVGYNAAGYALAVWTTSFDGVNYTLGSSVLSLGCPLLGTTVGWETPTYLNTDIDLFSSNISINRTGFAYITYMISNTYTGDITIMSGQTTMGGISDGEWSANQLQSNSAVNGYPVISVMNNGDTSVAGAIAWQSYNGSNVVIQAVTGSADVLQPPTDLAVVQTSNNEQIFTQYYNTITWSASTSSPGSYLIYRNNILIATTSSSTLEYVDQNRISGVDDVYGVAAYAGGEQSEIVYITL